TFVVFEVFFYLLFRQRFAKRVSSRRITNHGRKASDHQDNMMPKFTEGFEFAECYRVPEMKFCSCWINPEVNSQRFAGSKFLYSEFFGNNILHSPHQQFLVRLFHRTNVA